MNGDGVFTHGAFGSENGLTVTVTVKKRWALHRFDHGLRQLPLS